MTRLRGRAQSGERVRGAVPHGHWKTSTFVAALRHDRLAAPFVVDGPMNGTIFLEYVRQVALSRTDVRRCGHPGQFGQP